MTNTSVLCPYKIVHYLIKHKQIGVFTI